MRSGPYGEPIPLSSILLILFLELAALVILILFILKRTKLLFILFSMLAISAMINAIDVTCLRIKYHQPFYWVSGAFMILIPLFYILAVNNRNALNIKWKFTLSNMIVPIIAASLFIGAVIYKGINLR